MRIRNSRPPFPPPSLPDPTLRSMRPQSRNRLYFDDRFLVEETNRQIEWSSNLLKNPACQVTEKREYGELKKVTTMEIMPINCQDKKKEKSCCMQENSSQVISLSLFLLLFLLWI